MSALRDNTTKTKLSYNSPDALEGLAKVLMFGANKYDKNNWKKGLVYSEVLDSMLRHISSMLKGEEIDPESGLPHIDHIGCNWMFLSHYTKHPQLYGTHFNDLWV